MPAPSQNRTMRPDTEVIRIPDLSEWLSLAANGDSVIWAAYAGPIATGRGAEK